MLEQDKSANADGFLRFVDGLYSFFESVMLEKEKNIEEVLRMPVTETDCHTVRNISLDNRGLGTMREAMHLWQITNTSWVL